MSPRVGHPTSPRRLTLGGASQAPADAKDQRRLSPSSLNPQPARPGVLINAKVPQPALTGAQAMIRARYRHALCMWESGNTSPGREDPLLARTSHDVPSGKSQRGNLNSGLRVGLVRFPNGARWGAWVRAARLQPLLGSIPTSAKRREDPFGPPRPRCNGRHCPPHPVSHRATTEAVQRAQQHHP